MKTPATLLSAALLLSALAPAALYAQTTPPATPKPVARPARKSSGVGGGAGSATAMKLPANIPVVRGIPKSAFALKYIDSKIGTGDLAKPGLKYSVHYTGWLHDGTKFDSSVDRGTPIDFIQGAHRVIPGWDEGFEGMHVGGKRRLFIPYQLAYGAAGRGPIPAKADLIFDIELVAQADPNAPTPPSKPAPAPPSSPAAPATPPPAAAPATPNPATPPPPPARPTTPQ